MRFFKAYELDGCPIVIPVSRVLMFGINHSRKIQGYWLCVLADRMNANQIVDEYEYHVSQHESLSDAEKALDEIMVELNA